jgi:hypothetical protein
MSNSLKGIPWLVGTVLLTSTLPLDEIAKRISRKLDVELSEDVDGIYEEVPAYYTDVLGLRIVVQQGYDGYVLDVHPQFHTFLEGNAFEKIDFSAFLRVLVLDIPGIKVA